MSGFRYQALGLAVDSDLELPHLPTVSDPLAPACCVIRRCEDTRHDVCWCGLENLDPAARSAERAYAPAPGIFEIPEGWLYRAAFEGAFTEVFVRRDGRRVSWACSEEITEHDLRSLLSAVMLSAAASAQGVLVLHGSVVAIRDRHVALLAPATTGKSTLTAFLLEAGARLVSEDAFGVEFRGDDAVHALPASRALRLDDETLHALGTEPRTLPLVHLASDKRLVALAASKLNSEHYETPRLDALYLLSRVDELGACGARPRTAVEALARLHAMLHPPWMHRRPSVTSFDQQVELLRRVPFAELHVPNGLNRLRTFAESCLATL